MSYPRNPAEKVLFREQFDSVSSVTNNGGTIIDTPTISKGAIFDGSNDAVRYSETIKNIKSVVITLTATTTTEDIIDLDGGTHTIEVGGGTITATGFNSPTIYVDGAVSSALDTNEHQIAVTTATAFDVSLLDIGSVGASFFQGTIKEVSIYGKQLTANEIVDIYNDKIFNDIDQSKAILELPLLTNYTVGGNQVTDDKGKSDYTILMGDGTTSSKYPTQLVPHGMTFDGGDYLHVSSSAGTFNFDEQLFTICGWFRNTEASVGTRNMIIGKRDAGSTFQWDIEMDATGRLNFNMYQANGTNVYGLRSDATPTVNDSRWHFFAGVFDTRDAGPESIVAWLDEHSITTVTNNSGANDYNSSGSGDVLVGARQSTTPELFWNGDLARIKVFDFGLTETQIQAIRLQEQRSFNG